MCVYVCVCPFFYRPMRLCGSMYEKKPSLSLLICTIMSEFVEVQYVVQDWCTPLFEHAHALLAKCNLHFFPQAQACERIHDCLDTSISSSCPVHQMWVEFRMCIIHAVFWPHAGMPCSRHSLRLLPQKYRVHVI